MDTSRQTHASGNDTTSGISMYLSFDAESTMSSAAFKTIEASDIDFVDDAETVDISTNAANWNSTLEADENMIGVSPLKTVKKASQNAICSPLRPFSKNIMKEFKAICSTPSKEQLMRSVDVNRGSEAEGCLDLGTAFMGVDDDKKPEFEMKPAVIDIGNKENTQPDNGIDATQLSISSSVEVLCTALEQKLAMLSTTDEESVIETKIPCGILEKKIESLEQELAMISTAFEESVVETKIRSEKLETKLEANKENAEKTTNVDGSNNAKKETKTGKTVTGTGIPKHRRDAVHSEAIKVPLYAGGLGSTRPYREYNVRKPGSIASLNINDAYDKSIIPKLIDNMIHLASVADASPQIKRTTTLNNEDPNKLKPVAKQASSLHATAHCEKRPMAFRQRMSVVVKTTLNSPARKFVRRSLISAIPKGRKSLHPFNKTTVPTADRVMAIKKISAANNDAAKLTSKLDTLNEIPTTSKFITRKSMFPVPSSTMSKNSKLEKPTANNINKTRASLAPRLETFYTCSLCDSKFRVKSLLDAHRRAHETDNSPAFVKKQNSNALTTSTGSSTGSISIINKCKYCDKKFALERALHIHLLNNCSKIPAVDKRKLQFTEMDHVGKAQLPHFHHTNSTNVFSGKAMLQKSHSTVSNVVKSSTESLISVKESKNNVGNTDTTIPASASKASSAAMAPPSASIVKKKTAHSGVYRTPSKSVPCHICKQSFKSILDYTNHSMTAHTTNAAKK